MSPRSSEALQRLRDALDRAPFPAAPHAPLLAQLRSARDLGRAAREAATEAPALATAVPALDTLLAGGLPRGQMVELIGRRSSGRFSAALTALAAATAAGESAALVDLGDGLDPQAAVALGVDLERLLWLRPKALKQALASTEILITGGFPLVVLDLGNPPVRGGRGVEAGWLRLARAAQAHGTALLVASPYRMSGTAAVAVLEATRCRVLWQGRRRAHQAAAALLDGLAGSIALTKHRGQPLASHQPGRTAPLDLLLPEAAPLLDPPPIDLGSAHAAPPPPLAPPLATPRRRAPAAARGKRSSPRRGAAARLSAIAAAGQG
jgi:hypothetical protein